MYSHPHWQRRERGVIARMAEQAGTAPRGMDHEYTRLMARSKYHPHTNRDVRRLWKRICQECVRGLDRLVQLTSELDGLDRSKEQP